MTDQTPRLGLPYMLPSQAQKHVTHNAALLRLDGLAQLVVTGFDAVDPPADPDPGPGHALGAAPTGSWAGRGGHLAFWTGTAWSFVEPREGWRAWGLAEAELRVWRAGAWGPVPAHLEETARLGVATTADDINRLAVAAPATLLSHDGAGHRVKVNKAAAADTASLLFQSDWTGHAEMGLTGGLAFTVKTSADGATWTEAMRADPVAQTIGWAPAAAVRMELRDDALQLDVPLTGTAVQSEASDATAGRVLKTGAFGLGGEAIRLGAGDNLDDITATGFYYNTTGGNCAGNNYPLVSAGSLLVIYNASHRITQQFTAYGAKGNQIYIRSAYDDSGTTWTDWDRIPVFTTAGSLELSDAYLQTEQLSIADDAVGTVTPGYKGGFVFIGVQNDSDTPSSEAGCVLYFDVGTTSSVTEIMTGTAAAVTTGALTGTTGADGNLTVSAHTDGKLHIENRLGGSKNITIHILR